MVTLPTDSQARKNLPVTTGVLDYFPDAIAELAGISFDGNQKHNPGEPLHWAREKSTDHADCIGRHLLERGKKDTDGGRHSAKLAWRALAMLQLEIEAERQPTGSIKMAPIKSDPLVTVTCPRCNGIGLAFHTVCELCHGDGTVKVRGSLLR